MDQFSWWRRALAGEQGLPVELEKPEPGFYRTKLRDKSTNVQRYVAVAYWRDERGALCCVVDGRTVTPLRAVEMWPFVSAEPISHELYIDVTENGKPWPDHHPSVTALSNNPPADDSYEGLQAAIEDLAREAEALVGKGAAASDDASHQAADLANKLGELERKANEARKREKQPSIDEGKRVDQRWNPIADVAKDFKERLKRIVIAPWLRKKDEDDQKARAEAAKTGAPAPERPRESVTKAGTRGRSVALKSVRSARIVDVSAALNHFSAHPKVTDLIQQLADASVRAGSTPPGCEVVEEKVAA